MHEPTHKRDCQDCLATAEEYWAGALGLIAAVDTVSRRSRNPRRKAGGNRLWRRTELGVRWAQTFIAERVDLVYVDPQLSLFDGDA